MMRTLLMAFPSSQARSVAVNPTAPAAAAATTTPLRFSLGEYMPHIRLLFRVSRYTFAAMVLFLFTEPVRPKGKTIPELLFEDFWGGLPVESGTHTNVRMAAIYSRHKLKME